ncbi:hypothetical protein [Methylorubrum extorquens]|uniref:hypothetical protein n=1 Tax=Methylorubrum extorquens TaxID=408 RepID=UPI001389529C|nr:hypothetical protein [Methylorubrum extorquens]MCP1545694.1 hypothetical protein [Methylorubrum extorquens]MCP1591645.1 hypothetical protein [Methylorubrum extorquens]
MAVDENKLPNGRVDFHGKHPGPLPKEKPLKLADFYAARISTPPTLQWMVLSPPYTPSALDMATAARLALRQFFPVLMLIALPGGYSFLAAELSDAIVRPNTEGNQPE